MENHVNPRLATQPATILPASQPMTEDGSPWIIETIANSMIHINHSKST